MNPARSRARSLGWAVVLTIACALFLALSVKVNAVRSQVTLTERKILALRQEKDLLETEFQTRASQSQLTAINDVEFGYKAPTSGQFLESERELAALGKPRGANAPAPILVASAEGGDARAFPALANPLTGEVLATKANAAERPRVADAKKVAKADLRTDLGSRLARVDGAAPVKAKGVINE